MGYFPNGAAGMQYEAKYCEKCVHHKQNGGGCAVFLAHLVYNYNECDKTDSILHMLIPLSGADNEKCRMFWPGDQLSRSDELEM
jgi:hypothetical protein